MPRAFVVCSSVPEPHPHRRTSDPSEPSSPDRGDRSTDCVVLHVDMDAFFASVEVLDDPKLAGLPVIVGGSGNRGVVAACTYEARAFGIHSAMSSVEARHRCPQAVFVAGRYWRYAEVSEQLHGVLHGFSPLVEGIGLDEAFVDVAGSRRLLGSPFEIAVAIKAAVGRDLQLACSVGVARTKHMAKLASQAAKPVVAQGAPRAGPGVVVVTPEAELAFLHPLPVRALWGWARRRLAASTNSGSRPWASWRRSPRRCCAGWWVMPTAVTSPAWPAPRIPGGWSPFERRSRWATRRRSLWICAIATRCTPTWCEWPTAWRPDCERPRWAGGPSPSRCVSGTAPRSRAHTPWRCP